MDEQTLRQIAEQLELPLKQVRAAVELLEAGNTIPFIARYRKEVTGGLDEIALRAIEDAVERENALAARKTTVLKSIDEQGLLTDSLRKKIEACTDIKTLEAIYLPFKPKRRTRATIARERGLQPLADLLLSAGKLGKSKKDVLASYVNAKNEVPDGDSALAGALDIIAEQWSEEPETRTWLAEKSMKFGKVTSTIKRGKKTAEGAEKFEQYFDRQESAGRIPGHRLLAMMRGAGEGLLRLNVQLEGDRELTDLKRKLVPNRNGDFANELLDCVDDCFERLLMPATESAVLAELKERADEEAIEVFGKNLHELLMSAPAGPRVTLGIDPGFRTGCKVAVIDGTGKFLENTTIYPTAPKNDTQGASASLLRLIKKHNVELIAIGNGTASRETDAFVGDVIKQNKLDATKVMVSESGASIYSASELAVKEFPDLDITVRGAISIARRLQDPLAELVKTDPKSIGVGQYQHDVNQTRLRKCLDRTVESCVNQVGVDLNTASVSLLSYVAGIGPKLAEKIVAYRDEQGQFKNRKQLTAVPKLGKKAFEQAAGFLRIRGGDQPLDGSAVHPESYPLVEQMAKRLKTDLKAMVGNATLSTKIRAEDFVDDRFGLPTVKDIISELGKPGRDPRQEFRAVKFDDALNSIEDLRAGLVLEGVVTNVTHFGAFVDIGVHQDGLIHVSQLSNEFVSDPNAVVSVGEVVRVKVVDVDVERKRIGLTRKF
ncbi:Tex family protein [Rhodopirellula sp. MGV]|uniref:Tex family protein n=1 Tax=Rhodopirellula sp. MGV TaxID=2023130 RepID=UPI000B96786B|nr:Tex family protein [Rhodopirellula sp. MGV]OYP36589.1 RNA-binding transcriptional accessory protein [Rhodopirellula sp. MGV]PNY34566.1 RNA-binding transcriptional accessory protein [Rhodopirellula baltica]